MNDFVRSFSRNASLFWLVSCVVLTMAWTSSSECRTWYIKADGTGDAPTIQAGIDSAALSDVVLVGAGTYELTTAILLKRGITVTSESGAWQTSIGPAAGVSLQKVFWSGVSTSSSLVTTISGFWIHGASYGMLLYDSGNMNISNNLITGNGVDGILAKFTGRLVLQNNTIVATGYSNAVRVEDAATVNGQYNIIWGQCNDDGIWVFNGSYNDMMFPEDATVPSANFSADPQFCGPSAFNFYLQSDSPCAPGNSPWPEVGLIGAFPVGCGEVKTESRTWGSIKELFSNK